MMYDEKVTSRQIILLLIISRLSISISTMPTINVPPYNQDIWIVVILSFFYGVVIMLPLLFLANKLKEFNLMGYLKKLYGNIFGGFIGLFYGLYFMLNAVNGITNQMELVGSTILSRFPNIWIIFLLAITTIYTVSRGLIVRARGVELLGPISIIIILLLVLLGLKNVDFNILLPILSDSSLIDLNKGALQLSFFYVDIFLLVMIVPDLENKKDINKIFLLSLLSSTLILALVVVVTQGVLGLEQIRHSNFPFFLYTRNIDIATIFERIDAIFVMGWLLTSIARINGFIYLSVRTLRELLGKDLKEKYLVIIVGLAVSFISLYILNRTSVNVNRTSFNYIYNIIFFIFAIGIPLITCIVYFFRRKNLSLEKQPHNK